MSIGNRIKPLPGKVMLQPYTVKKIGLIDIPEDQQRSAYQSKVLAVGADTEKEKMAVKPGDMVYHTMLPGTPANFEGEDYIFAKHENILAIIKEEK